MNVDLKACGPATLRKMLAALRSREVRLDEKIGVLMARRADCGVERGQGFAPDLKGSCPACSRIVRKQLAEASA